MELKDTWYYTNTQSYTLPSFTARTLFLPKFNLEIPNKDVAVGIILRIKAVFSENLAAALWRGISFETRIMIHNLGY
jgi:hypothetical protein